MSGTSNDSLVRTFVEFQLSRPAAEAEKSAAHNSNRLYHFQQFTMAYQYYKANIEGQVGDNGFESYAIAHRSDWMPRTPSFLRQSFTRTVLFYWLIMLVFPAAVGIGMRRRDSDVNLAVSHVLQVWTHAVTHRPIPLSSITTLSARAHFLLWVGLLLIYLGIVMPFVFKWDFFYNGRFTAMVSQNGPAADTWIPFIVALVTGMGVAFQAAVYLDFNTQGARLATSDTAPDVATSPNAVYGVDNDTEAGGKNDPDATSSATVHPIQMRPPSLTSRPTEVKLNSNFFSQFLPSDDQLAERELASMRVALSSLHPTASPFLRSPARFLGALFEGLRMPDYSYNCLPNYMCILCGLVCAFYPNVISILNGGEFIGTCDDPYYRSKDPLNPWPCPIPNELITFGGAIRIVAAFGTVYFFAFVIYLNTFYFINKTHVRTKLMAALRMLLQSEKIAESAMDMQMSGLVNQENEADSATPSTFSLSSHSLPTLSTVPIDLNLWWCIYRFADRFDAKEGLSVQWNLGCYLTMVLISFLYTILAMALKWQGIDLQVLVASSIIIVLVMGGSLLVILFQGLRINMLPDSMHTLCRQAELNAQLALSVWTEMDMKATSMPSRVATGPKSPSMHQLEQSSPPVQKSSDWTSGAMEGGAEAEIRSTFRKQLAVYVPLLHRFADCFNFAVLSNPFTVLFVPITPGTLSAASGAAVAAGVSAVVAAVQGILHK